MTLTEERALLFRRLLLDEGLSYAEIGRRVDPPVTRQRVEQVLSAFYPEAVAEHHRRRAAARALRAAEVEAAEARAVLDELLRRMAAAVPCRVCGGWVLRGDGVLTCSRDCADAWRDVFRRLDPTQYDRHRYARARWVVANPDGRAPSEIALAQAILDGTGPPPNRRYSVPGSRAASILADHGIEL